MSRFQEVVDTKKYKKWKVLEALFSEYFEITEPEE